VAAFKHKGAPLTVLDGQKLPGVFKHALYVIRGDQHIAWRGDAEPANPAALVDIFCGAA
jgi:hypothetical protein